MKLTDEMREVEAAIWRRAISPDNETWSAELARLVLDFRLPESDTDRMNELAEKARLGELNAGEEVEAEGYDRVGLIIDLMKSKARQSLK